MGICTRIILMDEFDWDYKDFSRNTVYTEVKKIIPHAKLEADIPNMMIFDIGKSEPLLLKDKITCDQILYIHDNQLEIRDLKDRAE